MGTVSNQWSGLGQDWFKDYAQQGAEQAWGLLNNAPNAQASFVGTGAPAQMSVSTAGPAAQAAFTSAGAASQAAREQNRYLPQVANTIGQGISTAQTAIGTAQYDPSKMQQHLNPYLSGVNAEIARLGNENFQGMLGQINSNFTGAGQFGSARSMEMANKAAAQGQREISGAQANAMNQAYNQAAQSYQNWGQMGIGAAQQAANAAIQGGSAIGGLGAQDASLAGQIGMYNTGQTNQQAQFNAQQANEIAKYNAGQTNQQGQFNASALNQGSQFNAGQANQMSTANMGAANATNQFNAGQTNSGYINNMGAVTNLIGTLKPGQTSYSSSLNMRKGGLAQVKRFRNGGAEGEDLSLSEDELLGMIRDRSGYELPEEERPLEIPEGTSVPPDVKQLSPLEAIAQARNDRLPEVIEDRRALGKRAVEYAKEPVSPVSWNDVFDQWIKGGEAVARTGSRGAGWMASAGTAIAQDRARELEARKREGEGINTQAKLLDQEMGDLVKMKEAEKAKMDGRSLAKIGDYIIYDKGRDLVVPDVARMVMDLNKNSASLLPKLNKFEQGSPEWFSELRKLVLPRAQAMVASFTPFADRMGEGGMDRLTEVLVNGYANSLGGGTAQAYAKEDAPAATEATSLKVKPDSTQQLPKVTPSVQASRDDSRVQILLNERAAEENNPNISPEVRSRNIATLDKELATMGVKPPASSGQVQNAFVIKPEGVPFSFDVSSKAYSVPQGASAKSDYDRKHFEETTPRLTKYVDEKVAPRAEAANRALPMISSLRDAINNAPTGSLGEASNSVLSSMKAFGVPLNPQQESALLAGDQVKTASIVKAVAEQLLQKGTQTDKDFANYLMTFAGLGKNREENLRILAETEHDAKLDLGKNKLFGQLVGMHADRKLKLTSGSDLEDLWGKTPEVKMNKTVQRKDPRTGKIMYITGIDDYMVRSALKTKRQQGAKK